MAKSDDKTHLQRLYVAIRAEIKRIPRGRVATYGQVAELAGVPRGGRIAAAALKTSKPSDRLPWQRVIGKKGPTTGKIAIHDPYGAALQRQLLEREGVEIGDRGSIDLKRYAITASRARAAPPRRRPRSASTRRASPSRR